MTVIKTASKKRTTNTIGVSHIVCMGVSGSGKTSIGQKLASYLQSPFLEGDTLHSKKNQRKMQQGIALQDQDRWPWLENIFQYMQEHKEKKQRTVMSCSALKKSYRDYLRQDNSLYFLCLHADFEIIEKRLQKREGHFMSTSLLQSQYDSLELPYKEKDCTIIPVMGHMETVYQQCLVCIQKWFS